MNNRIVSIDKKAKLSIKNRQLIIDHEIDKISIPCTDINLIILNNPQIILTREVLNILVENKVTIISSDSKFQPQLLVLPIIGNVEQTKVFSKQIKIRQSLKNKLWKTIIQAKIFNQYKILEKNKIMVPRLRDLIKEVQDGDSGNVEAFAAKIYFKYLFGEMFVRDRDAENINMLLNYGYAVVRAIVARNICSTGLHPSIGLFHHSMYDPFPLASDLMEPIRPFVDLIVSDLYKQEKNKNEINKLTKEHRIELIKVLNSTCILNDKANVLENAIPLYVASIKNIILDESKKKFLSVPKVHI